MSAEGGDAKMVFCAYCGLKMSVEKRFCPKCGRPRKKDKKRDKKRGSLRIQEEAPATTDDANSTVAGLKARFESGPSNTPKRELLYSSRPYDKPVPKLPGSPAQPTKKKPLPPKESNNITPKLSTTRSRSPARSPARSPVQSPARSPTRMVSPPYQSTSATSVPRIQELEKENAELKATIERIMNEKELAMRAAGTLRRQLSTKNAVASEYISPEQLETTNLDWQRKCDQLERQNQELETEVRQLSVPSNKSFHVKFAGDTQDYIDSAIEDMRVPVVQPSELEFKELVGEGAAATVVKGFWQRTTVAIKVFKGLCSEASVVRSFVNEVNYWNDLRHPRIVPLYGACVDKIDNICCVVMPFYSQGSLYSVLQNKEIPLPWHLRLRIAFQIASGMRLLHARNVLHRDLKSLNVLLTSSGNALLSDFGLAKQREQAEQTRLQTSASSASAVVGTSFWLDPDIVAKKAKHSRRTDVYSFGITFNEIVSRQRPHHGLDQLSFVFNLASNTKFRPVIPPSCPKNIKDLIERCWHHDPETRPTFSKLTDELAEIGKETCIRDCDRLVPLVSQNPKVIQELNDVLQTTNHLGIDELECFESTAERLAYCKANLKNHIGAPSPKHSNVPQPEESKQTTASAPTAPRISAIYDASSRPKPSLPTRSRATAQSDGETAQMGGLLTNQLMLAKDKLKKSAPSNKQGGSKQSGLENQLDKLMRKRRVYIMPSQQDTQHTQQDWSSM